MKIRTQMMTCLALVTVLAASACSQYSINDQDQFVIDRLPQKGEDFSSVLQAALDWRYDPRRCPNLPGPIRVKVTKALVYASDPWVPRPDTASSVVRYHMHAIATLPSGQRIEEDSVEMMEGIWIHKKFILVDFDDITALLPATIDKDGAQQIYQELLRPSSVDGPVDAVIAASFIRLLSSMPIPASGSVDLQYWQRIHDLALTRHDFLKDQP
jgi:hypothetical protein